MSRNKLQNLVVTQQTEVHQKIYSENHFKYTECAIRNSINIKNEISYQNFTFMLHYLPHNCIGNRKQNQKSKSNE